MQLRFLDYFVALAREKHFARAAEACNVTQPTLSAGIAALEESLGKGWFFRDLRFIDRTVEGHAIRARAQRLLVDHEALRRTIDAPAGPLRGELRLGAIPAAMPYVGNFLAALRKTHAKLTVAIRSLTSREIERALLAYELDAGLTYLENEPLAQVRSLKLYSERYLFVTSATGPLAALDRISWADIAATPLCLLHRGMQNRRILDAYVASRGLKLSPIATADSYIALLSMVAHGGVSSVVTDSHAEFIVGDAGLRAIDVANPAPTNAIGLVTVDREPLSLMARTALDIAQTLAIRSS
ncbi:LysR family transcriptional regulator [soil metagenome]